MAAEMGLSLTCYRALECKAEPLDDLLLRSATFAALRIGLAEDKVADFPLAAMCKELDAMFRDLARSRMH